MMPKALLTIPLFVLFLTLLGSASSRASESFAPEAWALFEEKIRPALAAHCFKCHSTEVKKTKGGLALDRLETILTGGDTGPALVPHQPEKSLLIRAIQHTDPDLEMPPEDKLPDDTIRDFIQWVEMGAPFRHIATPAPASGDSALPLTAWWDAISDSDLLPADQPVSKAIDFYIDSKIASSGLLPAAPASAPALLRRLTLDLAGRIPTAAETKAFQALCEPDKIERRIDALIASPAFIRHQVAEFEWFFMDGKGGAFRDYLTRAFQENRSWARVFEEILTADPNTPETDGAELFLKHRVRDADRLLNDVSVRFFGVNISCAQCHDHPLVPSWKQDHYYGMKSFFNRTFENGEMLGERDYGHVSFKTVTGESKQARLMFLTGDPIPEPAFPEPSDSERKAEKERLEEYKKLKQPPPKPCFSRREQLIAASLKPGQEGFFARAIVNHLWTRFFGCELVAPADQMHGQNPPSHPELMQWLARDFTAHGYDLQRLMRGIVLSKTYARTSAWESGERPPANLFAAATPRPLTPQQLATSLHVAVTAPEGFQNPDNPGAFVEQIEKLEKSSRGWTGYFQRPGNDFQVSVDEALLFSNGEKVQQQLLNRDAGRLLPSLLSCQDAETLVEIAVWNVLSRAPHPGETAALTEFLRQDPTETAREQRVQQMLWALLTSTEFRFNH